MQNHEPETNCDHENVESNKEESSLKNPKNDPVEASSTEQKDDRTDQKVESLIAEGSSQRRTRHFEPGHNPNFRPSYHHRGGGQYRPNNVRMMNSFSPRYPMKNFQMDGRPANPNFFAFRPNRFHNNFPQGPPPPRFFKPNDMHTPRMINPMPHFAPRVPLITSNTANFQPTPIPQKVLINPNFKGGVEAVKSESGNLEMNIDVSNQIFIIVGEIMKSQLFSTPQFVSEDELLRKQEEFINQNVRQIQRRRNDRSPSPRRHRSRSRSNSPQRPRKYLKGDVRRQGSNNWTKQQQPEEDEETRAYREKIELQRRKREELLRQKEIRRKQQQADKVMQDSQKSEQLKPITVTDKKIVLKKPKLEERSTTPPLIKEQSVSTSTRRIVVLKTGKDS